MADTYTKNLSLIPDVYYDLISRVTPGVVLLLLVYSVSSNCKVCSDLHCLAANKLGIVVVPIIGLILAYVVGLGLSVVSGKFLFESFDRKVLNEFGGRIDELGKKLGEDWHCFDDRFKKDELNLVKNRMNILLGHVAPRYSIIITKHQAEIMMFANLAVGLKIIGVLGLVLIILSIHIPALKPLFSILESVCPPLFGGLSNLQESGCFDRDPFSYLAMLLGYWITQWLTQERSISSWRHVVNYVEGYRNEICKYKSEIVVKSTILK